MKKKEVDMSPSHSTVLHYIEIWKNIWIENMSLFNVYLGISYHIIGLLFFQSCEQYLMIGTYTGELKVFNIQTGEVSVEDQQNISV